MSANQLNGSSGGRNFLSGVDFYRRVPRDLTEATNVGATMSVVAMSLMAVLFLSESMAFLRTETVTSISLDANTDPEIRINFNITMFDLHCDYAMVDLLDALGTNRQNVSKTVEKWQLDAEGNRRIFAGRNRDQRSVVHEEHEESLDELLDNGVHAPLLNADQFEVFLTEHELGFVNFFAPWCMWCQRLHPTWEKFAETVFEKEMPLGVAMINCVDEADLCRTQKISAFPTIRWFVKGEAMLPDYQMDRTVSALTTYAQRKVEQDEHYKDWQKKKEARGGDDKDGARASSGPYMKSRPVHPGCQISGYLMVNRVPGNFHIEARSKSHNLNPSMTNLTHRVNHMSFGERMDSNIGRKQKRILKQVSEDHKQFSPLDGQYFPSNAYHQAFHHHIKVVSTHYDMSGYGSASASSAKNDASMIAYQFLDHSQLVKYDQDDVPEARFSYDISPMSVIVQKESRKWYDYMTSVSAIIGGTFTTLGLVDAFFYSVFRSKKAQ